MLTGITWDNKSLNKGCERVDVQHLGRGRNIWTTQTTCGPQTALTPVVYEYRIQTPHWTQPGSDTNLLGQTGLLGRQIVLPIQNIQ